MLLIRTRNLTKKKKTMKQSIKNKTQINNAKQINDDDRSGLEKAKKREN